MFPPIVPRPEGEPSPELKKALRRTGFIILGGSALATFVVVITHSVDWSLPVLFGCAILAAVTLKPRRFIEQPPPRPRAQLVRSWAISVVILVLTGIWLVRTTHDAVRDAAFLSFVGFIALYGMVRSFRRE